MAAPAPPEAVKKPPPSPPAKDGAKPGANQARGKAPAETAKPPAGAAKDGAKAPAQDKAQGKAGGAAASAPQEAEKKAAGERVDRMAVRAKMAVSAPGDAVEKEADRAADTVMRAMEGDAKAPEKAGAAMQQQPTPPAITRAPAEDQAKPPGAQPRPTVPADFARDLGAGTPLDATTRGAFERQFGRDFGAVRVHDDAKADAAARQIGARAFTLGQHIAFAGGQYDPGSPDGKRLIAHELAHVAQQDGGVARMVMRDASGGGGGGAGGGSEWPVRQTTFDVPPIKARHAAAYRLLAQDRLLRRKLGYDRDKKEFQTRQVEIWEAGVHPELGKIDPRYKGTDGTWTLPLQAVGGGKENKVTAAGDKALADMIRIPGWDPTGTPRTGKKGGKDIAFYQVDHQVEAQVGGPDALKNLELLDQPSNGSSGGQVRAEVDRVIKAELADPRHVPLPAASGSDAAEKSQDAAFVKRTYDVVFEKVSGRGENPKQKPEGGSSTWSQGDIEEARPVTDFLPETDKNAAGSAKRIALRSPTDAMEITRFNVKGDVVQVPKTAGGKGRSSGIAGFAITDLTLNGGVASLAGKGDGGKGVVGTLTGTYDFGGAVTLKSGGEKLLPLQRSQHEYAVKIGATEEGTGGAPLMADFTPLSPMEITGITIGRGVYASALIRPTHPALEGLEIPGEIRDGRPGIFYTLDASKLADRLKVPGLSIDGASITISYDGTDVGVGGSAIFTIRNFGQGELSAKLDTAKRFSLEGRFRADPRLFDQADMRLWYRSEEGFGGSGTLGINNPNKIKGIKSASVSATYEKGILHAEGTVQPAIPGVQSAGLAVTYGKDKSGADSLSIAGDLQLAAGIPGISGGSVKVSVVQAAEAWKVSASGAITPNLPGLSPQITLAYNDGLFDGTASAAFRKSIFSGDVTVGLTNRAVSPEGELSGTEPGEELRLYGKGTVTAKVAPWLQGGVAIKVKPTGQVLIGGRIGIPGAVTVFEQFPAPPKDRRTLFQMPTVAIPLLGAPGAGVSLNITGRVEGHASVGPGKLTAAEIGVEDFDPAQPDSLKVTGKGSFEVPATAGVDAGLDAGLAAGAVISLEAGLGVRAGIAAEAKAKTDVQVDWTAAAGLHLHADLAASVTPKLKFGVNGYVRVIAGAFGVNYELWRKDWTLAAKEAGGNLAIGVTAPVDYYSDGRGVVFDPEKVTFQVPALNAETLKGLLNGGGTESLEEGEGPPPD